MPRYDVRLEAQDGSGHFRTTSVEAADKKEARQKIERNEYALAAFQLDAEQQRDLCDRYDAKSVDELPKPAARDASDEDKAPFRALEARDRGLLVSHWQEQPYKVVSIEARKGA